MSVIIDRSPVQEITDGRRYDVHAWSQHGEMIGEEVPAWVARVIVACLDVPAWVAVHRPKPIMDALYHSGI